MRVTISPFVVLLAFINSDLAGSDLKSEEVYSAWLQMYDLKFQEAHITLERWQESHPDDSLGPASDAAAYLFSELTRLGVLESELFIDDNRFKNRRTWDPDSAVKNSFTKESSRRTSWRTQHCRNRERMLALCFAKALTYGLRADYVALIEGRGLKALSYTKSGRVYANRLMTLQPNACDAYLGPGVENYLLSLKPVALRVLLRFTGSEVDREKGLEQLRKAALEGLLSRAVREASSRRCSFAGQAA